MWAEKLYDGSFEGLSPYQFEFIKETDFKEKPWYPSGEVNRARYSLDRATKISGDVSKKIEAEAGAPCSVGLSQDGISVQPGEVCDFKCWFRTDGLRAPVRVVLHHGERIYASCEFQPGSDWQKFAARLTPSERDDNATLSIQFRSPGTLWLDNASLMPARTIGGWRPDVVEAVRALKPGVIRFGGSAVDEPTMGDFEWKNTIGDPDRRRPFRAWGGLQPTGPGLEEIVRFCRAVGAEPLICVRFTGREPKDAAEEIQYFNGTTNTPMGSWRARNGHPEPYGIKYWQVGNERGGRQYEDRLRAFCETMKTADPNIKLFSSFPTPEVIKAAGQWLDFACPHHYSHDLNGMENDLGAIERMITENAPGRSMHIAVTEWNTTAGDAGPRRAMLWTLANALACARYHNLLHRHADSVKIANRSNLINSFCSGILQTDNHRLYKTPTYFAQHLYATLAGNRSLKIESSIPVNAGPDLSATFSANDGTVTLFAVNDSLRAISRPLDFSAFGSKPQKVSVWILADKEHACEPDVTNSFDKPERISPMFLTFRARSASFSYTFPALSLTVLRWKVQP
jgi:alpha-N-arabinofuranosidase